MSLLAATSLGIASVGAVRATVKAPFDAAAPSPAGAIRLIVQAYSRESLGADLTPRFGARPRASTQRAVTVEELARGVDVRIVDLDSSERDAPPMVLAWVERGAPDLEYDAFMARPSEGAHVGVGPTGDTAPIVLVRRA